MTEYAAVCCCAPPPEGCFCGDWLNFGIRYAANEYNRFSMGHEGVDSQGNLSYYHFEQVMTARTRVSGRSYMGTNGGTCMYRQDSATELINAEYEYNYQFSVRTITGPAQEDRLSVERTTRWLPPQLTREESPNGEATSAIDYGRWQEREGPYVLLPSDGCCEASIPDGVRKTWFSTSFYFDVVEEYFSQGYLNGAPTGPPELYRDPKRYGGSVAAIYSSSNVCNGATGLVCDAKGWPFHSASSMETLYPGEGTGGFCESALSRLPSSVRFFYDYELSEPGQWATREFAGNASFAVTGMNFTDTWPG